MKKEYTHMSVLLDRTGSMESIRDDTIGGFNAFLEEQQKQPGQATLTLVQFDTQDPYEIVHRMKPIKDVPGLTRATFVPRAATPLLDAFGRGINDLEKSILEMPQDERPSRVILVVISDGQENSSREFRKEQIVKMIREKQEQYDWQFVFLSADLDAIGDATTYGVQAGSAMAFDKNSQGTSAAWKSVSAHIADYRAARTQNVTFTEEDRRQQRSEQQRKDKNP